MTMVLYGALAIILLIVCFATTRERVIPPPKQSTSLKLDLRGCSKAGHGSYWLACCY